MQVTDAHYPQRQSHLGAEKDGSVAIGPPKGEEHARENGRGDASQTPALRRHRRSKAEVGEKKIRLPKKTIIVFLYLETKVSNNNLLATTYALFVAEGVDWSCTEFARQEPHLPTGP